ncbi:MAG TPA: LytTR family DNA-binding domain-containing protein [Negativicutes bacterium]
MSTYLLDIVADFMDTKTPEMAGLQLAPKLSVFKRSSLIILITAFQEYAIEAIAAFVLPVVGYATKPASIEKLAKDISKVCSLTTSTIRERSLSVNVSNIKVNKICVLANGKIVPIHKREIVFVFVKDRDVFVRTKTGEFSSLLTMQEFENILKQSIESIFLRIHRQYIVNLDEILEIVPWFHGSYLLRMNDAEKQELPVSRNRVKLLKSMMGLK